MHLLVVMFPTLSRILQIISQERTELPVHIFLFVCFKFLSSLFPTVLLAHIKTAQQFKTKHKEQFLLLFQERITAFRTSPSLETLPIHEFQRLCSILKKQKTLKLTHLLLEKKNEYTSFLVLCLAVAHVVGDLGPCRFDPDRCSCKIGEANQGICWDKIIGQPGRCTRRFCKTGWTCACGGRTHVCYLANKNFNVVKNLADVSQSTADCETASSSLVNSREISLGTFKIHISKNDVLADDCTQIAWWHNGILLRNHKLVPSMSALVVDTEHSKREDHSLLELRPGDLLAFRFKEVSYYCYKHFSEMLVNGIEISTNTRVTTTHYSREYSADWFLPSFTLTEANKAADESETDLKKFLPLRTTKLSGSPISNDTDHWKPRDDMDADNKRSNWYYRIQNADRISGPTHCCSALVAV